MENEKIEMLLQQHKTEDKVKSLFKIFTIKTLLHRAGIKKEAGVPVAAIFYKLFLLAFHGCGINGMFNDKTPEGFHDTAGKDVYYRFMNTLHVDLTQLPVKRSVSPHPVHKKLTIL